MTKRTSFFRVVHISLARILWIAILTQCTLSVYAKGRHQELNTKITIKVNQVPVVDVLKRINREAKIDFAYDAEIFSNVKKVSLNVREEKVSNILRMILDPINMVYTFSDDLILIEPKAVAGKPVEKSSLPKKQIQLKGVVKDNKGQGLPGVSIKVKGGASGTSSNPDGRYTLTLATGNETLIFSFLGYLSQEVSVKGRTTLDVVMLEESKILSEIIVTALGVKREKKALAYSITEVGGDQFTQARENNIANALTGKVAGVNATGLSTGPGGSSRVIIRGNGSLAGANQPLYVVNGMPIDNTTPGGSATTNGFPPGSTVGGNAGNVDRGDGIAGINPDDIESIIVLKGGTAAALYGARAGNGVILITTKKGRAQKGVGVEYNSTYTVENASVFPDWQYEYGQGTLGVKPMTQADAIASGRRSYGAKIDGSTYVAADGLEHPYSAQKDNIKNFYRTGNTFTNTLAFTGGTEALTYRFSLSDLKSNSILPNSDYDRKTGNLNINGKLGSKITIEALAQYNIEKANNRPTAGDALGNPNWTPYMIANTADIRWLAPGYDQNNNEIAWNDASVASNSYFVVNRFKQNDIKNRFIGQAGITYEIVKNLSVKGTVSRDFYNYNYKYILPTGTLYVPQGQYTEYKVDASETNGMLTLNYHGQLSEHFTLTALAGANQQRSVYNLDNTTGSNFTIPFFYSSTNLSTVSTVPTNNRTGINSIFGSADLGFKNYAYLTFTGRRDWFSTLSPKSNSLFYPSVGGSFVFTDAFKLPENISFAKVRASWAQVGGGAPDPYAINLAYRMLPSSGQPLQNVSSTTISNSNLRPYTSTTTEAGLEARFFKSRLGFDLTLYNRKTTNDIVTTAISATTGYNNVILNVGELSNKGIELLLTGNPVKSKSFSWNMSYNFAYNKNEILKLSEGLDQIQMATTVNSYAYINNIVGKSYGTIVGTRVMRNAQGAVVFNATTGLPVATGLEPLGNGVAPLTMGFTNDFKYKNFSLSILVDGKFGNKIFSMMDVYGTRLGLTKMTLPGRENGLELSGVDQSGKPYSRTVPVSNLMAYYDNNKAYSELFVYDAGFVKLRQVILSYNIPVEKLKILALQSASISLVGRNLFTLYSKIDNFDPEQSFTNSASQGFESIGLPRTRTFGLNLMVKF